MNTPTQTPIAAAIKEARKSGEVYVWAEIAGRRDWIQTNKTDLIRKLTACMEHNPDTTVAMYPGTPGLLFIN